MGIGFDHISIFHSNIFKLSRSSNRPLRDPWIAVRLPNKKTLSEVASDSHDLSCLSSKCFRHSAFSILICSLWYSQNRIPHCHSSVVPSLNANMHQLSCMKGPSSSHLPEGPEHLKSIGLCHSYFLNLHVWYLWMFWICMFCMTWSSFMCIQCI